MTKPKRQLRAEAVERLKELNPYRVDGCLVLQTAVNDFNGDDSYKREIKGLIDLLTDGEPPEGDAVGIMRKAAKGGFPGSTGNVHRNAKVLLGIDGVRGIDWSYVLNMLADMVERDYVRREAYDSLKRASERDADVMDSLSLQLDDMTAERDKLCAENADDADVINRLAAERDEWKARAEQDGVERSNPCSKTHVRG